MSDIHARLCAPFDPSEEKTRDGKAGLTFTYVDARAVMRRLDAVVGTAGWQTRMVEVNGAVACELSIKFGDEWITKTDGAGETDIEGEKGQFADAFKRAAVHFGVARYLYDGPPAKGKREKAPPLKDNPLSHVDGPPSDFDEAEIQMRRLFNQLIDGQVDLELAKIERDEILLTFSKEEKKDFWFRFPSGDRTLIKKLELDW